MLDNKAQGEWTYGTFGKSGAIFTIDGKAK